MFRKTIQHVNVDTEKPNLFGETGPDQTRPGTREWHRKLEQRFAHLRTMSVCCSSQDEVKFTDCLKNVTLYFQDFDGFFTCAMKRKNLPFIRELCCKHPEFGCDALLNYFGLLKVQPDPSNPSPGTAKITDIADRVFMSKVLFCTLSSYKSYLDRNKNENTDLTSARDMYKLLKENGYDVEASILENL